MASAFYKELFAENLNNRPWRETSVNWPQLENLDLVELNKKVSKEEIRLAFFQMNPHKAPGLDDFPAAFYQKNWAILGDRVERPEKLGQFRHISLCNVLYKAVTKIIVNRLKPLLKKLISPFQSSFIPRRNIHDNVIIAQEMTHMMNRQRGGKAFMSIKIDLVKAYDRLSWEFINQVLQEIGIPRNLISIIQACLSTPNFQILWNGNKSSPFVLFLPLEEFCLMSGQEISLEKTIIFFSKNTQEEIKEDIILASGFKKAESLGKYLGAMLDHGRNKRRNYEGVIRRVRQRLAGWKSHCLSFAGRVTLAKSVISSIPSYHMQHGALLITTCKEIEKLQRAFILGDIDLKKNAHLLDWETLCKPKRAGGMGIISLQGHNEAFLHKISWKLLNNQEELWVRVLIGKYGRNLDWRREVNAKSYDSSTLWK
ncbi:uncharacterized protein LOC133289698 [Gastrolobium bilobum]|uniref:uncharacterized protein LOC133289698 n=1 Tax=Gastrolobium bilobum TaxID=150636 RepID=UPI002AB0DAE3|nr:uncharacterized protein LOC133289698 [Gastrolobium bilobum]